MHLLRMEESNQIIIMQRIKLIRGQPPQRG